jgi:hypothetical protein
VKDQQAYIVRVGKASIKFPGPSRPAPTSA